MAEFSRRIPLDSQSEALEFDELPKTRLLLRIGIVASSGANKTHIGDTCLSGGTDKFHGYVSLVVMGGRDQANRVATSLLQGLDDIALPTRDMRDYFDTERFELLRLIRSRIQGESSD